MRKAHWVLIVSGLVGVALAGDGCSSDSTQDDPSRLPPRENLKDSGAEGGGNPQGDSGTDPPADCTTYTKKVSDRPECDKCTKDKCCAEILACSKSADCDALQTCLEPCAQDDDLCILTCIASHESGSGKLQEVGSCAQSKCKTECPPPDAGGDPFDSGL